MKASLLTLMFCLVYTLQSHAGASSTLVIPKFTKRNGHPSQYFFQALTLALSKTEAEYGPVTLKEAKDWLVGRRLHVSVAKGEIDIVWAVSSEAIESLLLSTRIPLLKDLDDYRVLLIRKGDQARFDSVHTLEDLRQFTGGMSSHWPDAKIMYCNALPTYTATGYGTFYKMLAAGRYDYFSRGLYQVFNDVNFYPELELQIEKNLFLHYPGSHHFYVRLERADLAERIEKGLRIAIEDGSLDALFSSISSFNLARDALQKSNRRVIKLKPLPFENDTFDHNPSVHIKGSENPLNDCYI